MTREESRKALCGRTDPIPERSDLQPLRVLLQRLGNPEKALIPLLYCVALRNGIVPPSIGGFLL